MITSKQLARILANDLRKNHTYAEKLLWEKLRKKKMLNLKFLRQHPIFYQWNNVLKFFIADFYCHEIRLVIEIDGKIHSKLRDYDKSRSEILQKKNMRVIRFTNQQIISNIDHVVTDLKKYIFNILNSSMDQLPSSPSLLDKGGGKEGVG